MRQRKTIATALISALALLLTGCGGQAPTATTTTAAGTTTTAAPAETKETVPDAEKPVLTVYTHRTDRVGDGSLAEITKPFEEENDCIVKYIGVNEYEATMAEKFAANDYGDVLMVPDFVKLMELEKYFEPLGTYGEIDNKYNCADQKMYNGTVYGIPQMCTVAGGICYNKKVWADAGITELPETPEEFLKDLQLIRDNTDAIPYYTNFAAADWTLVAWASLVISASGDPDYENNILINGEDLFVPGGAYYETYKLMYDIFSDPTLIEPDPRNSDWEGCKGMINRGEIATMVMGSWAVSQFAEAGPNPDDIGFMPVPFSFDDRHFAQIGADYCYGVNRNSPDNIKELGKKYITWYVEESGFAQKEGGVPTMRNGEMPEYLGGFADCWMFTTAPAPEGLVGVWDTISADSGVSTWAGGKDNFKTKIAEVAFEGKDFSEVEAIFKDCNEKWAASRDANPDYIKFKS
ncbi:MAG: carbohydrate ABC transporter substrate-binding protein [Ruminiclostridium sp.]|nr:carbohydrate ABC transporter substrate-binding protein [Ruminiclostridium sp.]